MKDRFKLLTMLKTDHEYQDIPLSTLKILETVHLPTKHGTFTMSIISYDDNLEHIVLERLKGQSEDEIIIDTDDVPELKSETPKETQTETPSEDPIVRIHSECMTGDIFGSHRCDCGEQLEKSLEIIGASDHGYIFYLRQEGRGIGLLNKLKSYNLQEQGLDTIEANHKLGFDTDLRDYKMVADYLTLKNINSVKLITNNPKKSESLRAANIIVERVPLPTTTHQENKRYKDVKVKKMGHFGH